MLSNDHHNFQGHIFFSIDYNYSFKDFLASYSPQVDIIDEVIVFEQGYGYIGNTNHSYTDYKKIYLTTNDRQSVNKSPDNKITTDILYKNKPFSHNPSYQPLSNNKYNENNIYHKQNSDMGYADYQVENN
ncbi:hypothetical protein BBD39_06640 [Arsenophonus endosymbiont of Bemisia tabaci Asia II 3]|nr:hypothetical protein BBD39_06640 [Arsenophonus endosymbiont of Bemisia tabaci Asia II 3]